MVATTGTEKKKNNSNSNNNKGAPEKHPSAES
jgi:hypothetical protein